MATVNQKCGNCGKIFKWKSQPTVFGKHPAGNIMLSFGIITSGAKISQTLLMLKHMGLCAISPRTYFYHQKNFHFPAILSHWGATSCHYLKKFDQLIPQNGQVMVGLILWDIMPNMVCTPCIATQHQSLFVQLLQVYTN